MCRWIVYLSHPKEPVLLADIISRAQHSLVVQSTQHVLELGDLLGNELVPGVGYPPNAAINIDGWGIAYWAPDLHIESPRRMREHNLPWPQWGYIPNVFRSIMPIPHDLNAKAVISNNASHCIFGHIRAGTPLALENSHPFRFGKFAFQHNGYFRPFGRIQWKILHCISSLGYIPTEFIKGTTDSEHIAALFFFNLAHPNNSPPHSVPQAWNNHHYIHDMVEALQRTVNQLETWSKGYIRDHPDHERIEYGSLNIAISDGEQLLALCYAAPAELRSPGSLYYSTDAGIHIDSVHQGHSRSPQSYYPRHVVVASEKSHSDATWERMKNGELLVIGRGAFEPKVEMRAQDHDQNGRWPEDDPEAWGHVRDGRWWPKIVPLKGPFFHSHGAHGGSKPGSVSSDASAFTRVHSRSSSSGTLTKSPSSSPTTGTAGGLRSRKNSGIHSTLPPFKLATYLNHSSSPPLGGVR